MLGGSINLGLLATTVLLIAGAAWAATGFYDRSWGTAALGALSGVVSFVIYIAGVLVVAAPHRGLQATLALDLRRLAA